MIFFGLGGVVRNEFVLRYGLESALPGRMVESGSHKQLRAVLE